VHIRLSPDSYKDLIDPAKPKSFPFRPGMSASADIQTTTHISALSVPINAVTTREKNSDNAVLGSADADNKGTGADGDANNNNNANNNANNTKAASAAGDPDEVAYVLEAGDTVKKVKVRTDIQDINYIEIVDGLKEGDQVITGPYSIISKTLKTGMKVKVVPKDKLFDKKDN
jgi:HlyD family secretion protein